MHNTADAVTCVGFGMLMGLVRLRAAGVQCCAAAHCTVPSSVAVRPLCCA